MKVLELKFLNAQNRVVTLSLDTPIEPLSSERVKEVMDQILLENAFSTTGGQLVAKDSARIVERYVTDIPFS